MSLFNESSKERLYMMRTVLAERSLNVYFIKFSTKMRRAT